MCRKRVIFLTGVKELESQSDYQSVDDLSKKIYNVCVNLEKDNYHVVSQVFKIFDSI